jgi:hypothetical protein
MNFLLCRLQSEFWEANTIPKETIVTFTLLQIFVMEV